MRRQKGARRHRDEHRARIRARARARIRVRTGRHTERGSSTIVALGTLLACMTLMTGLGLAGKVFFATAKAEGTADMAALAAADAVRGVASGDPCTVAKKLVEKDGAELVECIARADLGTVKVVVRADLPKPLPTVKRTAVAGEPGGR